MLLLCKDEVDIIRDWLRFHKAMGVDGFIITDNGSTDGTREVLEEYRQRGWILNIIDETEEGYLQAKWVDRMIRLAKNKYHADWIISSDADEFWYATSLNLKKEILANEGCNLQSVYLTNFIPIENRKDFINSPYFAHRLVPEKIQEKYGLKGSYSHQVPKVIMKAKDYKRIVDGNHDAEMRRRKICHISNITVYHYFIRNFDHFVSKVKKGGEALMKNPNKNMGMHWRIWYRDFYLTGKMNEAWDNYLQQDVFDKLFEGGVIIRDKSVSDFMKYYAAPEILESD